MSFELIGAIVFILAMALFLIYERKKVEVKRIFFPILYFVMYRSKLGLKLMDKTAKFSPRFWRIVAPISIVVGFLGMALMSYALIDNIIALLTKPDMASGVGLVLPIKAKGVFYVPFFFWIISIFIIATVHEFSHGIFARVYNMKIKSSGFAFLNIFVPIIPAAFVEPDEKEIIKRPAKEQLAVYSAGPFSNVVLAFVILGIVAYVFTPIMGNVVAADGVAVTGFMDGNFPAKESGMVEGELVTGVDGRSVVLLEDFSDSLQSKSPGDTVAITTNSSSYDVVLGANPDDAGKAYLGVFVQQHSSVQKSFTDTYGEWAASALLWLLQLFYFLYILNLGIGLFNLAPIGPLDGGRMLLVVLEKYLPQKKAIFYWKRVGFFFFALVLLTMLMAFIR